MIYLVHSITTPVAPPGWTPDGPRQRWPWTGLERQVLRERYIREGVRACEALLPARGRGSILNEAARLALRRQRKHRPEGPMTPEIERALRAYYTAPTRKRGQLAALAKRLGRSRQWLGQQARALGIVCGPLKTPRWTPEEDALLESLADHRLPTIVRRLAAAGYRRTATAVAIRLKRMGVQWGQDPDVWTANGLAKLLGCDVHRVLRWIERGALKARRPPGVDQRVAWEVRRKDVRAFLIAHPGEWDHRGADHLWLIEILAGTVGPSVDQLEAAA